MIRKSDNTIGLKVKVEASVGDRNSGVFHKGWATANIIQPKVQIDFLGPDNKIVDPDMSYTTMVSVNKRLLKICVMTEKHSQNTNFIISLGDSRCY